MQVAAELALCMAVYVGLTLQAEIRKGRVQPGQLRPVEAVQHVDIARFRVNRRGTGSAQ